MSRKLVNPTSSEMANKKDMNITSATLPSSSPNQSSLTLSTSPSYSHSVANSSLSFRDDDYMPPSPSSHSLQNSTSGDQLMP